VESGERLTWFERAEPQFSATDPDIQAIVKNRLRWLFRIRYESLHRLTKCDGVQTREGVFLRSGKSLCNCPEKSR
jgi:hypothetical protein